ncbi:MAG: hypothetical protein LBI45_02700 [Bacteroidales bacterium]|jgi:hypothetical protein|nr:hypothetical protein [Bacteroidales bacterium]
MKYEKLGFAIVAMEKSALRNPSFPINLCTATTNIIWLSPKSNFNKVIYDRLLSWE